MTTEYERLTSTVQDGPLAGRTYDVRYRANAGPPVVILHEVLGPSPQNVELADFLADRAPPFSVYMPVLFGDFGKRSYSGLLRSRFCLRREFTIFRLGRTSPIVMWLRQLVGEVSQRHQGSKVGVIGMCLTGGFVFGLIAEGSVAAGVAGQPSLPMGLTRRIQSDLGLFPDDYCAALNPEADLTYLRFTKDVISPKKRQEEVIRVFGGVEDFVQEVGNDEAAAVSVAAGNRDGFRVVNVESQGRFDHSVLTAHLNEHARELVAGYLDAALR